MNPGTHLGYRTSRRGLHTTALAAAIVVLALEPTASAEEGELTKRLRELRAACDQGLLTPDECESSRKDILKRFSESSPTSKDRKDLGESCNYADGSLALASFDVSQEYSPSANALQIVREILDEAGLAQNFVVRQGPVPNAAAVVSGYDRYILYNPDFLSQLKGVSGTNWSVYSVMAHEIAHHLQGHTLVPGGSRPPTELEADKYSGFILARLGATLDDAKVAMSKFGSEGGSTTHPARSERLQAIDVGWNNGKGARPGPSSPKRVKKPEPEPEPCDHECSRPGERECADELEERVCRRDDDGCLYWDSSVCDDDEECVVDRCRRSGAPDPSGGSDPGGSARYCCDFFGMRRCIQTQNPAGVGEPCFCYGQGNGIGCN